MPDAPDPSRESEPAPQPPEDAAAPRRGHSALLRWGTAGPGRLGWQIVVPVVFAAAGFLFVTSADASDGADLRPDRPASLAGLVQERRDQVDQLRARTVELEDDLKTLTESVSDAEQRRLERRAEDLRGQAGFEAVVGDGLRVTLDDAPVDQAIPESGDPNDLVVHQQDLQAVINALWAGGAEAISLQDQRLISTTAIKCVGNTVVLHGVPYSPPYEIEAIGPPEELQSALDQSEYVQTYLQYTDPPYDLGWDVDLLTTATVPAFEGTLDLSYARALPPSPPTDG